jgi:hypothetical protein
MLYDCVIPYGPNDQSMINLCIENARKNLVDLRNIYIVSYDKNFQHPLSTTIDEKIYPFQMEDVKKYINPERTGWYLQQLLKMYSHKAIPELSEYFLILDSDTIFNKRTEMFYKNTPLYNVGTEYHLPYFKHMNKLLPELRKISPHSGICHHMIFNQNILNEIFHKVEERYQEKFWIKFLEFAKESNHTSGASEYEIYFTYLHIFHPLQFKIRFLKWQNVSNPNKITQDLDYGSIHWYARN